MLTYSCFDIKHPRLRTSHFPVLCACAPESGQHLAQELGLSHVTLANLLNLFSALSFSHVIWRKCCFLRWWWRFNGTVHLQLLQQDTLALRSCQPSFPHPPALAELAAPGWVLTNVGCAWIQWSSPRLGGLMQHQSVIGALFCDARGMRGPRGRIGMVYWSKKFLSCGVLKNNFDYSSGRTGFFIMMQSIS